MRFRVISQTGFVSLQLTLKSWRLDWHGRIMHNLISLDRVQSSFALLTRVETPRPQVFEHVLHAEAWGRHLAFDAAAATTSRSIDGNEIVQRCSFVSVFGESSTHKTKMASW